MKEPEMPGRIIAHKAMPPERNICGKEWLSWRDCRCVMQYARKMPAAREHIEGKDKILRLSIRIMEERRRPKKKPQTI